MSISNSNTNLTQSANENYQFDQEYFNRSLHNWIQDAHRQLSLSSGWKYWPLKPGQFGYDNMAVSLGYTLETLNCSDSEDLAKVTEDQLADLIHQGWCQNYLYWRDNKPWLKGYRKPNKPLGDQRRNDCAQKTYKELPDEEQEKDRILARFLIQELSKH